MRARPCIIIGVFFFLAGCGTMRVDIDYGNTPLPGPTDTLRISTSTPTPSVTPAQAVTQTVIETTSPTPTESPSGIVALTADWNHTCAVTEGGAVKCWGAYDHDQLGNGTAVDSLTPVDVVGLDGDVVEVITGYLNTCVRMRDGRVKCWGSETDGILATPDNALQTPFAASRWISLDYPTTRFRSPWEGSMFVRSPKPDS